MEEWRDIKGYEGIYQVSNEGRVKTLGRTVTYRTGKIRYFEPKVLSQHYDKDGYCQVSFCVDGKTYQKKVHRLVAQGFIPNPNNYPMVNHKDECKTNNFVFINEDGSVNLDKSNLEWCDCKYNLNYGTNPARISERVRNNKYLSKEIVQITLDGNIVKVYPSTREVERELSLFHTGVSACALGKISKCGGFKWKYLKDMNSGGQKTENQ